MRQRRSQRSRVSRRRPLPSAPSTRAIASVKRSSSMRASAVAVEADADYTEIAERPERLRQIGHQCDGNVLECARRRLGERACQRRAVPARHDEAAGGEHRRRSQDRPDVMRVGDLIEHDQRSAVARPLAPARPGSGSGRASVSSSAPWCTVSAPSRRSRSRGWRALGPCATRGERRFQAMLGVVGQKQPADAARRIGERRLDGVNAIELHHVAVRLLGGRERA